MRVHQKIERALDASLRRREVSEAQFDVIAHVGAAEGLTQQELAASLLVTKGNVTQLLDRLEQCEMIERRQDGRAKRIYLTERGQEFFTHVVPEHEALIAGQFAALTPEEQRTLLRLLRTLDKSIERTDAR